MPPKGKKKKTKAELEAEKLLKEEEERKAKALEDKRAAEEAEKKRLEDIRIQGERNAFRQEELQRLSAEYAAYIDNLQDRVHQMVVEEAYERDQTAWLKYKDPTDEPDAESERDINTFLSLVSETQAIPLPEAMQLVNKVEKVSKCVETVLSDCIINQDTRKLAKCREYLNRFFDLINEKLDVSTNQILRYVDRVLNDRLEFNVEEALEGISMGMWASFNEIRPVRKSLQFEKLGVVIDLPKQVLGYEKSFLIHRVIRFPFDNISCCVYDSSNVAKYQALLDSELYVIGDLLLISILLATPQPTQLRAKKWVIRDRSAVSMSVRKFAYPSTVAYKVVFKVADYVIMSDDVRVMVWDEDSHRWTDTGISDFQYSESNRLVQFYCTVCGTFALVRHRNSDLPYKRWSLTPIHDAVAISAGKGQGAGGGAAAASAAAVAPTALKAEAGPKKTTTSRFEQHVRLSLQTQRHEVVIDVVGSKCRLIKPVCPQLEDVLGVEVSTGFLLFTLQRRGINIVPIISPHFAVEGVTAKAANLEEEVLQSICRCATACEFLSTRWNQQLSSGEVGVLARESTAYTGSVETFDYECLYGQLDSVSDSCKQATVEGSSPGAGVKFLLVMGNEYGDKRDFSLAARPAEVTHIDVATSLSSRLTEEAKERITRSNERFVRTLHGLLRTIHPVSLT